MNCSICGKVITGDAHHAFPVTTGECCTSCNDHVVIPIRLYNLGNNEKEGLMVTTDGKVTIIKPTSKKFSLKELQTMVDGYIEYYPTNNKTYRIIVNEEGLIRRLPLNTLTSHIYGIHAVGNVLIIPKKLLG